MFRGTGLEGGTGPGELVKSSCFKHTVAVAINLLFGDLLGKSWNKYWQ